MSRTDKTNPYLVRLWDGTLERVAHHDHRRGECDLPGTWAEHERSYIDQPSRCTWDLRFTGVNPCCCSICRAQPWVRADQRGARRRSHMRLEEVRKTWLAGGVEDFD